MFIFIYLMAGSNHVYSQTEEGTTKLTKEKKAKAAKDGNAKATNIAHVSGLNRDEKNKMVKCPIHNKHMVLSDNFLANGSEYTSGDNYPLAYQLNYRRYCNVCTRIMKKETVIVEE
ncbi:hypothetical protein OAK19_02525 [Aureispira]|nr:hypothetical protein [Aureispira sp.]